MLLHSPHHFLLLLWVALVVSPTMGVAQNRTVVPTNAPLLLTVEGKVDEVRVFHGGGGSCGRERGSRRFSVVIVIEFSQSTIKVRAVAAIHEVIQGTRKLNTQRARHGVSSPKPTAIVDC